MKNIVLSVLALPIVSFAGSLDPAAGPAPTMVTLQQLYQSLETITQQVAAVDARVATVDDRVAAIPSAVTNNSGAVAADVLDGKAFWSLTSSEWGPREGSMPVQSLTATSEVVSAGYYNATTLSSVDTDFAAENIAQGVVVFGVQGSLVGGSGQVPQTGQMTSFYTGDDGDLRKGVPDGQERFELTDGGLTVTDNHTGLMWSYSRLGSFTWTSGISACNNSTLAGYNDWRMPNIYELMSIHPMLPGKPFSSDYQGTVWSANTSPNQASKIILNLYTLAWPLSGGNEGNAANTVAVRNAN